MQKVPKEQKSLTQQSQERVKNLEDEITAVVDKNCNKTKKNTVPEIIAALSRVMYNYNAIGLHQQREAYGENNPVAKTDT